MKLKPVYPVTGWQVLAVIVAFLVMTYFNH
jgi:hypothetical protein